jgi:hypothetical protein
MVPKINTAVASHIKEMPITSPISTPTRAQRRSRPLSISFNPGSFSKIVEGRQLVSRSDTPSDEQDPAHCTCACHASKFNSLYISTSTFVSTEPIAMISNAIALTTQTEPVTVAILNSSKSTISSLHIETIPPNVLRSSTTADSSMQTDPMLPGLPYRTMLRISTATDSDTLSLPYNEASSALDIHTPLTENLPAPNPVYMGRMMDYFSKPGYQLGDSLFSSYQYYQQPVYQEEDVDDGVWGTSVRRQTV